MEFLSLLQKYVLSYASFGISFSSPKIWTIICNINNLYPFPKNLDYHMQFLEFLFLLHKRGLSFASFKNSFLFSKNLDYHMLFMKFLSLIQNCGLSYSIFGISFSSPKTWSIICSFRNFYPFSKNMDYHI